jgi:hypothetical protein
MIASIANPIIQQRDALLQRLEDGDRKIAMARSAGSDVTRLENLWIKLLREYEATCNAIATGEAGSLRDAA